MLPWGIEYSKQIREVLVRSNLLLSCCYGVSLNEIICVIERERERERERESERERERERERETDRQTGRQTNKQTDIDRAR